MTEYALSYHDGYAAGLIYPWPSEWRELFGGIRRPPATVPAMSPAATAGWMRGFRHGCMDQVQS